MATILIVDDSILMRRNLKMMLTEAGHDVVGEAANGIEAYKEYVKTMPDIVTMDITMPVMSGIDAVKKIIASYPEANIVMISAIDQRSMVFDALQNGAKHYILKPITAEKVLQTIGEVLHQDTAAEENAAAAAGDAAATAPPAFDIANKNGVFIIALRRGIGEAEMTALGSAAAGFQFLKPLKVIFAFEDPDGYADDALARIAGFAKQLQQAGGAVRTVSPGKALNAKLKALDDSLYATIYTDLSQVVL